MKKVELIVRLNAIAAQSNTADGSEYTVSVKDWENNGKIRTYFKVSKTWRKKYQAIDYGYFDNVSEQYVPGLRDLSRDTVYDFGGNNKIQF